MKKVLTLGVLLIFLLSMQMINAETYLKVVVDDTVIQFTSESGAPFVDNNNRVLVPFRVTLEKFGAEVSWDKINQMAIAKKDGIVVKVPVGESFIYRNGEKITIDTISVLKDSRIFLPIRAVLEAFGAELSWDNINQTVFITSKQAVVTNENRGNILGNYGNYCIYNEYLFYSDFMNKIPIIRVNIDGTNEVHLLEETSYYMYSHINVLNGWVYYTQEKTTNFRGDPVNLYKMGIDGKNNTLLIQDSISRIQVVDNYIYYGCYDGKIY